jgi:hypothetical protein
VTRLNPEDLDGPSSYSIRRETPGQVLWNRVSVTASLFTTALAAAFILGRKQ